MHTLTFQGKEHQIYDLEEARREGVEFCSDWRKAKEGDWVETDTGHVLQVLQAGKIGKVRFVRTATGTWDTGNPEVRLDHERKKYRWSLYGRAVNPLKTSKAIKIFAEVYARTSDPLYSWYISHPRTKSERYATVKSKDVLRIKSVQELIRAERMEMLKKAGIDREWIYKKLKALHDDAVMAETSEDRKLRLSVLKTLESIFDRLDPLVIAETFTEKTQSLEGDEAEKLVESQRRRVTVEGKLLSPGNGNETS